MSNLAVHRATPFGINLRHWRAVRGLTQLELATTAQTPARHVSFLETGRARPSQAMVTRLADAMALSLRDHNALLASAGFGPSYSELPLEAAELQPFRDVVSKMLTTHDPYPAYVIDRHWNILDTNAAAGLLLPDDGERNAVRLTYAGAWRTLIANWADIAWIGVRRLQAEAARQPNDLVLAELLGVALQAVHNLPQPHTPTGELMLCPQFAVGGSVIRTMTVVAQFGSTQDLTLDEMRIELIYPADDEAAAYFARVAAGDP